MNSEIEYNPIILAALNGNKQNYPMALATAYPRILEKLIELWGSSEFDTYICELMFDDRCTRHGFPPVVGSDLLYLVSVHTAFISNKNAAKKAIKPKPSRKRTPRKKAAQA